MYTQIALLLLATAAVGVLALRLRQPIIVAYILVGILAGPSVLGWVQHDESMELLAEIGITVLLFVVGLKLDINLVKRLGPVALATGLGQLGFTIVFGFMIAAALGMDWLRALYVAVALTFSSTIIIVKLLSDKREIDELHGRIAMGFLIVQDIAVVVAMTVVGAQDGTGANGAWWASLGEVVVKLVAMAAGVALLMRYVLPRLVHWMAASQELLLIFAIAWGLALAAGGQWLGFSKEVGAFLAGFSLASLPFRESIHSRLSSLRDFLLLFFFVNLGAGLDLSQLGAEVPAALVLSAFVLVGNPLIVAAIMGVMGYRKRTGFLAGLTVAQISEFSIIFIAMGVSLGHVDEAALGLVTLVGLITITASTYMILYSKPLYRLLERPLSIFERRNPYREREQQQPEGEFDVLVFGVGRYGTRLAHQLSEAGLRVLGVDSDPEVIRGRGTLPMEVVYGDASDLDFVRELPLSSVKWTVSTLRDHDADLALVNALRQAGYEGRVAVTARSDEAERQLRGIGADEIFQPLYDAADHAAEFLLERAGARGGAGWDA